MYAVSLSTVLLPLRYLIAHNRAGNFYNNIFSLLGRDINLQSVMDDFGNLLYAEIDCEYDILISLEIYASKALIGLFTHWLF